MSSPFQQRFSAKSPLNQVDPDAPGTKGKPGYEPPVVRKELDANGKEIYDNLRKENARLLKSGMTQKEFAQQKGISFNTLATIARPHGGINAYRISKGLSTKKKNRGKASESDSGDETDFS